MLLILAVFIALISCDCLPAGDNTDINTLIAESTCAQIVLASGLTADQKAAGVCTCINTAAAAVQPNCDANSLLITSQCAASTILAGITNTNYNFGATCSTCANPPASPNFPSPCLTCIMNYAACLTTGYFNLKVYPSIANLVSLKQVCGCVGQLYNCLGNCGGPLSALVGQYCNTYNFCGCSGNGNVGNTAAVVAYLKTLQFTTFQANIQSASAGALTIDCAATTNAAGAGLANDRFICSINFVANSPDYASFHVWVTNFLGKEASIALGTVLSGPVVALKRDAQETMVAGTYTIVVAGSSGSVLTATFSLCLVLGAMLVLLF